MKKNRDDWTKYQEKKQREMKRKDKKKRKRGEMGYDSGSTNSLVTDDEF